MKLFLMRVSNIRVIYAGFYSTTAPRLDAFGNTFGILVLMSHALPSRVDCAFTFLVRQYTIPESFLWLLKIYSTIDMMASLAEDGFGSTE